MVAYSFRPRFAEPILEGVKGGTIRGARRRHARPGEELQLYTGMRTKRCRLIARKTCLAVEPVALVFELSTIWLGERLVAKALPELDAFARFDGFASYAELREFWRAEQPAAPGQEEHFAGVHVRWLELPEMLA